MLHIWRKPEIVAGVKFVGVVFAGGVNEDRHERARRFLERCQVQIWQGESVEEVFAGINKDGDEKLDADEVLAVFRKLHITLDSGARRVYPRGIPRTLCAGVSRSRHPAPTRRKVARGRVCGGGMCIGPMQARVG